MFPKQPATASLKPGPLDRLRVASPLVEINQGAHAPRVIDGFPALAIKAVNHDRFFALLEFRQERGARLLQTLRARFPTREVVRF